MTSPAVLKLFLVIYIYNYIFRIMYTVYCTFFHVGLMWLSLVCVVLVCFPCFFVHLAINALIPKCYGWKTLENLWSLIGTPCEESDGSISRPLGALGVAVTSTGILGFFGSANDFGSAQNWEPNPSCLAHRIPNPG